MNSHHLLNPTLMQVFKLTSSHAHHSTHPHRISTTSALGTLGRAGDYSFTCRRKSESMEQHDRTHENYRKLAGELSEKLMIELNKFHIKITPETASQHLGVYETKFEPLETDYLKQYRYVCNPEQQWEGIELAIKKIRKDDVIKIVRKFLENDSEVNYELTNLDSDFSCIMHGLVVLQGKESENSWNLCLARKMLVGSAK
jgi:hypothetical protein